MKQEIASPRSRSRLWSRDFTLATLSNFFASLVFYLLVTVVALYVIDVLKGTNAQSGFAVSAFVGGTVVSRLFVGQIMDLVGRRRVLVSALACFLIFSAAYLAVNSLWTLIAVRFGQGLAFGAANTTLAASIIGLVPRNRRSEGTGWFGTSTTVAAALGPMLALKLTANVGYEVLFGVCTVFSALAMAVGVFVCPPEVSRDEKRGRRFSLRQLLSIEVLPVSSVILVGGLSFSTVLTFLNGYVHKVGLSPTLSGIFFMVYATTLLVSRLFVGPAQDRYGDNIVIYPLTACLAAGLLTLSLWPTPAGIVIAAVPCALGFGALMTSLQSAAISIVRTERVGVATSTYFLMLDLGFALGAAVFGVLLPTIGYRGMYFTLSGVMVAAMGLYWLTHGRRLRLRSGVSCDASVP